MESLIEDTRYIINETTYNELSRCEKYLYLIYNILTMIVLVVKFIELLILKFALRMYYRILKTYYQLIKYYLLTQTFYLNCKIAYLCMYYQFYWYIVVLYLKYSSNS